jgi:hypothetical protein
MVFSDEDKLVYDKSLNIGDGIYWLKDKSVSLERTGL